MKQFKIYEYQAKQIENTLRIVARTLESVDKETCLDRDIMKSWEHIKSILKDG